MYNILAEKPFISQPALIELGHRVANHDQAFRKAYEESERKQKGRKNSKSVAASSRSQMADNFVKKASATDTLREMQRELNATLAQLAREEDDHERNSDHSSAIQLQTKSLSNLAAASPLATTHCIGPSASSKLNYIISEVIHHLWCLNWLQHLTFYCLGSKIRSQRKVPHFL